MIGDQREPMAEKLSTLKTKKRKSIENDTQSKLSNGRLSSLKLLDYDVPVGVCPKAELEDDCK